jgi:Cytochrome c554 and c-prime
MSTTSRFAATVLTTTTVGLFVALNLLAQTNANSQDQPDHGSGQAALSNSTESSTARDSYLGDIACASCHRDKVDSFHQTAHYLTSRLPGKDSILGKFVPDANVFKTSNPDLFFRMEQKGDDFFQTAVQGISPYATERTERFGFVIGSGGKGQTYLYWKGDQLFQLPISYWTELGWVNSPGYRDGVANFDRPIIPRCLECHATYFASNPPPPNRYDKGGFAVGIICEKCHGPGREHVLRESSKPAGSSNSAILNPKTFSRDRKMDLCAWCHAGQGAAIAPTFSYLPGEPLNKYLELPRPDPNAELDVHGSQVELLGKSRCFQSSAMTCLTCHDAHTVEHDPSAFSQRCLSCHKPETAMFPKMNHRVTSNCIDCHMPKQATNLIVFDSNGKKARPQVRSHWIRIYPEGEQSK